MTTPTCCLRKCKTKIPSSDARIEIQCSVSRGGIKLATSVVRWSRNGQAIFHPDCWQGVLSSARARRKKNMTHPEMSEKEKSMIIEASKTLERHDSEEFIKTSAEKIADMIRSSKHCVCFTGAGLSTAAGIGDYRGKSGKWTQMDQEKNQHDDEEPPEKRTKYEDTQGIFLTKNCDHTMNIFERRNICLYILNERVPAFPAKVIYIYCVPDSATSIG